MVYPLVHLLHKGAAAPPLQDPAAKVRHASKERTAPASCRHMPYCIWHAVTCGYMPYCLLRPCLSTMRSSLKTCRAQGEERGQEVWQVLQQV